jgi:hypothetical protein
MDGRLLLLGSTDTSRELPRAAAAMPSPKRIRGRGFRFGPPPVRSRGGLVTAPLLILLRRGDQWHPPRLNAERGLRGSSSNRAPWLLEPRSGGVDPGSVSVACSSLSSGARLQGRCPYLLHCEQNGVWSSSVLPIPSALSGSGHNGRYTNVACAAAGTCLALGDVASQNGFVDTPVLAIEMNGSWTTSQFQAPPNPPYSGMQFQYWSAEQCPSAGWCVAVAVYDSSGQGNAGDLGFATYTLANGVGSSGWLPMPGDAAEQDYYPGQDGPLSLSCPAAGQCVAAGTYLSSNNVAQPIDTVELFPATWTLTYFSE